MPEAQTRRENSSLYIGSLYSDEDRLSYLPQKLRDAAPAQEPRPKSGQWRYRVAEPFYTAQGIKDVQSALEEGEISSAASYAQKLSQKVKDFYDVPVAFPVSSGASALIVALLCSDVGPGDQVIVPSLTMVAVANGVKLCGATPIYADNAPNMLNPSWEEIEAKSTPKTKAVIVCHTYGVAIKDIQRIADKCREKNWFLIEDICEALGNKTSEGKLVGKYCDFACASLYANKLITAGDGGWVHALEEKYHDRLKSLINHGFDPRYHFLHFETAPNAKVNGLGATLACASMEHIPTLIEHRQMLARTYRAGLKNLEPDMRCMEMGNEDAPWVFGCEAKSREMKDALRNHLGAHDIETRNYFHPLHLQPVNYFAATSTYEIPLPICEKQADCGFYLPSHTYMSVADIKHVCGVIQSFFDPTAKVPESAREYGWAKEARLSWTPNDCNRGS